MVKRIFDLTLALLLLIPVVGLVLVCGGIVRATSPGPALFFQKRVGYKGRVFTIVKLRTMYVGASDAPVRSSHTDPRVTNFGKFLRASRIDELPQIVNILLGHMSIVGPRPLTVAHFERSVDQEPRFGERVLVRPGIAGIAQLRRKKGLTSTRDRFRLDLFYIQRQSVLLDLWILGRTCMKIFRASFRKEAGPRLLKRNPAREQGLAPDHPDWAGDGRACCSLITLAHVRRCGCCRGLEACPPKDHARATTPDSFSVARSFLHPVDG